MIIDAILNRKEGGSWKPHRDLRYIYYESLRLKYDDLGRALDAGTEDDVKYELCRYIDSEGYNPTIKNYILSANWLGSME